MLPTGVGTVHARPVSTSAWLITSRPSRLSLANESVPSSSRMRVLSPNWRSELRPKPRSRQSRSPVFQALFTLQKSPLAGNEALAAFALDRADTQLTASVGGEQVSSGPLGFGQGQIVSGSSEVSLGAPLSPDIIVMAVVLAILGGLLAGLVGGWRAARLRPVDALRHVG